MPPPSDLYTTILPLVPADIPDAISLYFLSFQDPLSLRGFPRVPAVRTWFQNMLAEEVADPGSRFWKVCLKSPSGEAGDMVGFCKWNLPKPASAPPASASASASIPEAGDGAKDAQTDAKTDLLPSWPDDEAVDAELLSAFFGPLAQKRSEIMGKRNPAKGYIYLEMLGTHPAHQGRGIGRSMLKWGLDEADRAGVEAYLEASPKGLALYKKVGFESVDTVSVKLRDLGDGEGEGVYSNDLMIRRPAV